MRTFFIKLFGSLNNNEDGSFSAKKLSAWVYVMLSIYCHRYCDRDNVEIFNYTDCSMVLALLTVSAIDKLKVMKQKAKENEENHV